MALSSPPNRTAIFPGAPLWSPELSAGPDEATLIAAAQSLSERDPLLARARELAGIKPWRRRPAGYAGLARIICFQQISTAAGIAIWRRVEALPGAVEPHGLLTLDEDQLRSCGLSRPKIAHMRAAAQACLDGSLDFDRIKDTSDDAARAELCAIKGVGAWSADIYLMFALGRMDIFPAGDLALRESCRRLSGDKERLSSSALLARAENWRPYRSVAAHLLWSCIAAGKKPGNAAW